MKSREKIVSTATAKNNPKVAILLLNYNGWRYTIECLESIYRITYPNYEVVLVDNGSVDESVSKIKEWATGAIPVESMFCKYDAEKKPTYVEELLHNEEEVGVRISVKENLMRHSHEHEKSNSFLQKKNTLLPHQKLSILRIERNRGFAGGNNIGMEYILRERVPDYILLLSNDTVIDTKFVEELVRAAEGDVKIGIIQPKMLRMNDPKMIDSTGHVFKFGRIVDRGYGEVDEGQYDTELDIIGACAGACMYKSEMLEDVGLFDESFFMYYEDAEFSWRAHKRGWKGRFAPTAIVYHKGGGTNKTNETAKQKMSELCAKNRYTTVRRHGTFYQNLVFTMFLCYIGIKSEVGRRIGRNDVGAKPYLDGVKYLWKLGKCG